MLTNTLFRFSPFSIKTKSPERVQVKANARADQSERLILIDKICESLGTRYSDLVKYRTL